MNDSTATNRGRGNPGVLSRMDPRARILLLLYASVLSVLLDSLFSLCAMSALCLLAALCSGLSARQLAWLLAGAALVTWGTMFSQAIFYYGEPRTVLLNLVEPDNPLIGWLTGEMNVYREGFRHGAIQSLRFTSMMMLGLALCWSTDARGLMQGLLGIRTPYVLAFMSVTALRFLPGIMQEASMVQRAWQVRGMRVFSPNPFTLASNWIMFVRPVIVNGYRRSVILALSLQSRAFSPANNHSRRYIPPMPLGARFFSWLGFLAVACILCMKTLYWLYLGGVYYNSSLRNIYMICRHYI